MGVIFGNTVKEEDRLYDAIIDFAKALEQSGLSYENAMESVQEWCIEITGAFINNTQEDVDY